MRSLILSLLFFVATIKAEPWVGTSDIWLRADVEALSSAGIIKVPVSTYPLMWASIVKDLDNIRIEQVPDSYKDTYWRVKKRAKAALNGRGHSALRLSVNNSSATFKSFGDVSRDKLEFSANKAGMNKSFAWNINITHVSDHEDENRIKLDNSYVALVLGNWVGSAGYIEMWWGPSWISNNLFSNSARPLKGVSVQRNYSNVEDSELFSRLGPWSFSMFVAEVDSTSIDESKFLGGSFSFKPVDSLEIAFRATGLRVDNNGTENSSGLVDSFFRIPQCDLPHERSCSDLYGGNAYTSNDDLITGYDVKWKLPTYSPLVVYFSSYEESESQINSSMQHIGLNGHLGLVNENWSWIIELSEKSLKGSNNIRSETYNQGYGYLERTLGSRSDIGSKVLGYGLAGSFGRRNKVSIFYMDGELNSDENSIYFDARESLLSVVENFKALKAKWSFDAQDYGEILLSFETIKGIERLKADGKETRFSFDWKYNLN